MSICVSLAGLGQVLEFMYTAKLSLNSENVDDVLAVASFLQMQDIITACHSLKSLAEPATSPGGHPEIAATEGKSVGRPTLSRWLWMAGPWPCLFVGHWKDQLGLGTPLRDIHAAPSPSFRSFLCDPPPQDPGSS